MTVIQCGLKFFELIKICNGENSSRDIFLKLQTSFWSFFEPSSPHNSQRIDANTDATNNTTKTKHTNTTKHNQTQPNTTKHKHITHFQHRYMPTSSPGQRVMSLRLDPRTCLRSTPRTAGTRSRVNHKRMAGRQY